MGERPDMSVPGIEGSLWEGSTLTPAQRDEAVDALCAALKPLREVTAMSDFETAGEVSAYYQGVEHGAGEYEREHATRLAYQAILTDLIAELKEATGFANRSISFAQIGGMAVRAEARLKEVIGDE